MIAVNQGDNIFSYKMKCTSHICYQKIVRTNKNMISIILENPTFGYFFKIQKRMSSQKFGFSDLFECENRFYYP